jgi:hypothetical protein
MASPFALRPLHHIRTNAGGVERLNANDAERRNTNDAKWRNTNDAKRPNANDAKRQADRPVGLPFGVVGVP